MTNLVQMPRKKQCVICGDIGVGKNFGAVTCEPCKVFFRRKTLENKKQKCRFDGNCIIDVMSRKRCTSCRMKKCIHLGMKKIKNIDDMFVKLSFSPVFSHLGNYKGFSDLETSRLTEVVVSTQLALIKYGCHEILMLRYSILYNFNIDSWIWAYKALTAILLFDPNRPNLIHRDVVK
ncbi:unnamed protein product [Medioppia subpectinata]|uniref:Nuclear receptor domain-containing protein n=1 Tax=Medioppia subpectinata TaxID=1979941 RepID=A0A7R9PVX9_9ACAR|nr:unnamed protein product [Medioppia subpectinata]CAG2103173.1 unnamed protein product [Medioppia subpectinata]